MFINLSFQDEPYIFDIGPYNTFPSSEERSTVYETTLAHKIKLNFIRLSFVSVAELLQVSGRPVLYT